jgi:hypothetical protein
VRSVVGRNHELRAKGGIAGVIGAVELVEGVPVENGAQLEAVIRLRKDAAPDVPAGQGQSISMREARCFCSGFDLRFAKDLALVFGRICPRMLEFRDGSWGGKHAAPAMEGTVKVSRVVSRDCFWHRIWRAFGNLEGRDEAETVETVETSSFGPHTPLKRGVNEKRRSFLHLSCMLLLCFCTLYAGFGEILRGNLRGGTAL